MPFADVNIKVSYRRNDTGEINQYIVKSISHDISNGVTSWGLMKFYPLYKSDDNKYILSDYTHEELSGYTHEQLMNYGYGK